MLEPQEWDRSLQEALDSGNRDALHDALGRLRRELDLEEDLVIGFQRRPLTDRLLEQARRLVQVAPTEQEALMEELIAERKLWSEYRQRYRESFVPSELQPFLDGCAAFIRPVEDGIQYDGFEKYTGHTKGRHREAATLFVPIGDKEGEAPPNFFSNFEEARGRFQVRRCYRTVLPRGGGTACMIEQVRTLVPNPADLRALAFNNVQNRSTYDAYVDNPGEERRLRDRVEIGDSPLGRLASRIFVGCGLTPGMPQPSLDTYGILDLEFPVG